MKRVRDLKQQNAKKRMFRVLEKNALSRIGKEVELKNINDQRLANALASKSIAYRFITGSVVSVLSAE